MTDKFTGNGSFHFENGNDYSGEWVDGLPHGYGKMTFANNDQYEGDWSKGKMHGKGEYMFFDEPSQRYREIYNGQFDCGKRHGYGTMSYKNRCKYVGSWQNDQKTGDGVCIFPDGNVFHGIWKFDAMVRGVYALSNGDFYDGEIKDGVFNGYGKYYWHDGSWFEGVWKDGKPFAGVKYGKQGIMSEYKDGSQV